MRCTVIESALVVLGERREINQRVAKYTPMSIYAEILRDGSLVTFAYAEEGKRVEVPRHGRKLTLNYSVLSELGLAAQLDRIASAFWALRDEGHIDAVEVSYRTGDPNETVVLHAR